MRWRIIDIQLRNTAAAGKPADCNRRTNQTIRETHNLSKRASLVGPYDDEATGSTLTVADVRAVNHTGGEWHVR